MATPAPTSTHTAALILNIAGAAPVALKRGEKTSVAAKAGQRYRVVKEDATTEAAKDVAASQHGQDLWLTYADGTQVALVGFYDACKAEQCALDMPGATGTGASGGYVITGDSPVGTSLVDGGNLVYAYGERNTLLSLAQSDSGLVSTLTALPGEQLTYIPTNNHAAAWGEGHALLGMLGGGVALGAAGGAGSAAVAAQASYTISVLAVAGTFNSDATVDIFDKDGKFLATGHLSPTTGQFVATITNGYAGPIFVRVSDANGTGADYLDEASNTNKSLNTPLRAMAMADGSGNVAVTVSPLTELAVRSAGIADTFGDAGSTSTPLTTTQVATNQKIGALFGVADITGAVVTVTEAAYNETNGVSAAENYGKVLAALSGVDASSGAGGTPGTLADSLTRLEAGIVDTGTGTLALTQATVDLVDAGAAVFESGANATKASVEAITSVGTPVIVEATGGLIAAEASNGTIVDVDLVNAAAGNVIALTWGSQTVNYTLTASDIANGVAHIQVDASVIAAAGQGQQAVTAQIGTQAVSPAVLITVDTVVPTIAITSDKTALKAGETATIGFTLTEAATDFEQSDVTVSGGTLSNFAGSGTSYSATFTPDASSNVAGTVSVAGSSFTDTAVNGNTAASALSITVDTAAPTITITSDKTALKAGETATIVFTLSEAATDFEQSDVTVSGGTLSNWTANSATSYTATFTPDASSIAAGTVNVSLTKFTDAAGNANTASNMVSMTFDTAVPTIAISSDKTALKAGETATIVFTLSEAATNFDSSDVTVTGGTLSNFTANSATSYSATFTPDVSSTAAGTVNVSLTKFTDAAGNSNTASNTVSMTVDTVVPTMSITSDKTALKAGETATIVFTLTEAATDFEQSDVAVSGGTLSGWTAVSATSYTAVFTPTTGSNTAGTVSVASGKFSDAAGNANADGSDVNNTVSMTVDTVVPTMSITSDKTALITGETAVISFTLAEAATNFVASDVIVSGGTLSAFTGSGTSYSATFTPTANSTTAASVNVAGNTFTDAAGNGNTAASGLSMTVNTVVVTDTTPPTIAITSDQTALGVGGTATLTFTLSESASDFTETDITVTGGTLSNFTGSGTSYSAVFMPTAQSNAAASISVGDSAFSDIAGNQNADGADANNSISIAVDTTAPPMPMLALQSDTGRYNDDRVTQNGTVNVSGLESGASWQYQVSGSSWTDGTGSSFILSDDGVKSVLVRQTDAAGNVSAETSLSFTRDGTVATPTLALAVDSGNFDGSRSDGKTSNGQVDVSGLESGASWEYQVSGSSSWTAGTGNSFILDGDGDKSVVVRQTDVAGNLSVSSSALVFTLDTTVAAPTLALSTDSGVAGDHLTKTGGLTLSGAEAGASVEYRIDGFWDIYEPSPMAGDNTVYVRQTDVAGNVSAITQFQYILDSTAPTLVSSAPADGTNLAPADNLILSFSEALQKGSGNIRIVDDTGSASVTIATIPVSDSQVSIKGSTVTINPTDDLVMGKSYHLEIDATAFVDAAGNAYAGILDATTLNFVVPSPVVGFDPIAGDNIVNAAEKAAALAGTGTIAIGGTLSANVDGIVSGFAYTDFQVTLTPQGEGSNVTATVSAYNSTTGAWSGTLLASELVDGMTYDVVVVASATISGTLYSPSTSTQLRVYGSVPAPTLALAQDSGTSSSDGKTSNGTVNLSGLQSGATWEYDSGSGWTAGSGSSFTLSGDGAKSVVVRQTDVVGTVSANSSALAFTLDGSVATPTLVLATDSGNGSDGITNTGTVNVSGLETGATWEYSSNGGSNWSAGSASSFSLTGDGTKNVLVRQTDLAGNVSATGKLSVTLDTAVPTAPTLALSVDTGASNSDAKTSDGTVNVSGLESGATWEYSTNSGSSWTTGSASSFTLAGDGAKSVVVRQTDIAGNVSANSSALAFTLDTTVPTVTVGRSGSGTLGVGQTASITFTLSEAASDFAAGDISVSGGTLSNFSGSGTSYSATFTPEANSTTAATVSVASGKFTDAAGNANADGADANNSVSMTVDTVVVTDTTAPTVQSIQISDATGGQDGLLNAGDKITVTVVFSEAVTLGSGLPPQLALDIGGTTVQASYNNGSGTDTLSFAYTVLAGQLTLDGIAVGANAITLPVAPILGTTTVRDAAGNDAVLTHEAVAVNSLYKVDALAPNFTSSATAQAIAENSGAGQVVYSAQVSDDSNLSYSLKANNSDDAALFSIDSSTGAVTLTGNPDYEAKSGYSFTVVATDAAGNAAEQAVTLAITDVNEGAGDTTPPTISITADATELVADDETTVYFTLSEASADFNESAIEVTGGTLSNFTELADGEYAAFFTPDADSTTPATIRVASRAFADLAGNPNTDGSDADNTLEIAVNSVRPVIQSLEVNAQGQLVLTYDQALSNQLPTENFASVFTIEVDGIAQIVNSLSVSGAVLTVTLSQALPEGDLRFEYTDPTGFQNGVIRADSNGNDAAGFIVGTVADGYIQGAQVYIDTDADGLADAGEIRQGVTTSAKGSFLLSSSAPSGTLIAMGGTDVSTGLAQTTPLKAPAGSRIINPLTTLVQEVIEKAALASPAQTLSVQQASDMVTTALGLSLPTGKNLCNYEPLAAKDGGALATQKAAAQLGTLATLVALDKSDTADDVAVADQMYAALALQILNPTTTTVDLTDSTVFGNLGLQTKTVARMGVFSNQIDAAVNLTGITEAQKRVADNTEPTIAISSDKSSLGAGETATITFTLSEASTDFVESDVLVTGGTLSYFSGSGKNYTATFTPTPNSSTAASISVASGQFNDLALNTNSDGAETNNAVSITVDALPLALESTTPADGDLVGPKSDLVLRFSKPVQAVSGKKIRIVNDSDTSLVEIDAADTTQVTVGTDGTVTLNPTADLAMGKNYHIEIDAAAFVDLSGSAFAGIADATALNFTVPDPAISLNPMATDNVVNATENAQTLTLGGTLSSTVGAGVLSSFSQANFTVKLTPGVGTVVDATMVSYDSATGAWSATVAAGALLDGQTYSVQVAAINANNLSASSKGSLRVDTSAAAPSAQLRFDTGSSTSDGISTNGTIDVTGLEKGATWEYRTGGSSDWTAGEGNSLVLQEGSHSLQLRQTDAAGNTSALSTAQTVVVDTTVPTIAISSDKASLGVGETASIIFTLSESSTDFSAMDITVSGGTLSALQGSGTSYSATFTPTADSTTPASITVMSGQFADAAGNKNIDGNDTNNTVSMAVNTVVQAPVTAIELSDIAVGEGGFVINGQCAGDYSGNSVASAGDVNGDGLVDLIVGAYYSDPVAGVEAGRSYVVFGRSGGTPVDLSAVAAGSGGFVINAQCAGDKSGYSVASAGDINGDGLADLIVGAMESDPLAGLDAGRSYVIFGQSGSAAVDLSAVAAGSGGFVINGQCAWDCSGYSVSSAGDVNGDGLADLILGAVQSNPVAGDDAGRSYVVFGRSAGTPVDLSAVAAGSGGFVINGQCALDWSGSSVSSAGDVNGDGLADLIVGANNSDPVAGYDAGRSYVVFGRSGGTPVDLSAVSAGSGGFVINGQCAEDNSCYSVARAGDVNGDGLADLIVGAPYSDPLAGLLAGRSYVIFGRSGGTAVDLSAVSAGSGGFVINGQCADDLSGISVSSAGDVNGDGLADLIVGAPDSDPVAGPDAGRSYVIFGRSGSAAVDLSAVAAGSGGFVINGQCAWGLSGYSVSSAGDVDGDGLADLIVGAVESDPLAGLDAGRSYVIFGRTDGAFSQSTVDWLGTDQDDTQSDGGLDKTLVGGAGNDTLTGTAASVLYGGAGNDTFNINAQMLYNLQHPPYNRGGVTVQLARIDGGTGTDTLAISGRMTLDLSTIAATRVESIEVVDLTDVSVGDNNMLKVSSGDVAAWAGMNLINSSTSGWSTGTYTLSATERAHQLLVEGNAGDVLQLGSGWADVGAINRSYAGNTYSYKVYASSATREQLIVDSRVQVILPGPVELSAVANGSGGFVINGQCANDMSGFTVSSAGDVNGDGFDDLIIGAKDAEVPGIANTSHGRAYVVFGQSDAAAINLSAVAAVGSTLGFVINGSLKEDFAGFSVAGAGDVNGDGKADIIVGSPGADSQQFGGSNTSAGWDGGRAYVIFGKTDGGAVNLLGMSTASNSLGFMINGVTSGDGTGNSVAAAGDVNGDGLADVLVGAKAATVPDADAFGSGNQAGAGRAYIVFGKTDTAVVYLSSVVAAIATGGFVINGRFGNDYAGIALTGGADINGDGLDDVVIGADGADTVMNAQGTSFTSPGWDGGQAYVVFGKTSTSKVNTMNIAATAGSTEGFLINGLTAGDYSGNSVELVSDINGDGLADILVGAKGSDASGDASGRAYVVFGKTDNAAVQLSAVAAGSGGFVINGQTTGDQAGYSVAALGDLNADGLADYLVGARQADSHGSNSGRAYVVFGRSDTQPIDLSAVAAGVGGFAINGQTANDEAGFSVSAAGDLNGDGFIDLLVGAPGADPTGASNGGRSYVIWGNHINVLVSGSFNPLQTQGTPDDDTMNDNGQSTSFVAGQGNDALTASAASVLYAGKGDDTIRVSGAMLTALENTMGSGGNTARLARVDGGEGLDTLALIGGEQHLNLSQVQQSGSWPRMSGIEVIDLTGNGDNVFSPTAQGVIGMGGLNLYNAASGWTNLANTAGKYQVRVEGNAGDWVNLPTGWTLAEQEATWNGNTYKVYTSGNAQMLINSPVTVQDDLAPTVQGVALTSANGAQGGWLGVGDTVTATVTFSEVVKVNTAGGTPTLALDVGGTTVLANYVGGHSSNALTFTATITAGLGDTDGIAIWANAFALNGGLITDLTRSAAIFTHNSVSFNANYTVDGVVATPNATALNGILGEPGNAEVGATVEYRIAPKGGSFGNWTSDRASVQPVTDGSADGRYQVQVRQTDVAGNVSDAQTLTLDVGQFYLPVELADIAEGLDGFVINGQCADDSSGYSVSSAGDVNGDGLTDLIVGAIYSSPAGDRIGAGRSYVVFGHSAGTPVDLSAVSAGSGGFVINGQCMEDSSGYGVASAGDVNGDGLSDLIVGAPFSDPLAGFSAGRSYVVFGRSAGTAVDLSAVAESSGGFVINGQSGNDRSGGRVSSAGDVNGDGLADLIVGATGGGLVADSFAGRSYIIFGRSAGTAVDLSAVAEGSGGFVINGQCDYDYIGNSVDSAGDVNGDGLSDLIVGAYLSDSVRGGHSYVVFGRSAGTPVDLSAVSAGSGGFVINGQEQGDESGYSVSSAGDFNGDGLADLIVGARQSDPGGFPGISAGRSYVVFGRSGGTPVDLSAVAEGSGGFVINGQCAWDLSGSSVASAGDVNGDGLADLIVGAWESDPVAGNSAGRSYVVFGNTSSSYGQTAVDFLGTDGNDSQSDGGVAKTLVAGAGNDTLSATAASVLYGGAGNDAFNIDATMIAALLSPMGSGGNTTKLARIDGGGGLDTIVLSGAGLTLELTQVANQAASNPDGGSRIDSVEIINLTGTGDNNLKLNVFDVLDMGSANLFQTSGRQQLLVKGNAGDTVDLADGDGTAGWTKSSTAMVLDSTSYDVWNHQTSLASLYVQNSVLVI